MAGQEKYAFIYNDVIALEEQKVSRGSYLEAIDMTDVFHSY